MTKFADSWCSTSFLKLIFEFLDGCSLNQFEFFAGLALPCMLCFFFNSTLSVLQNDDYSPDFWFDFSYHCSTEVSSCWLDSLKLLLHCESSKCFVSYGFLNCLLKTFTFSDYKYTQVMTKFADSWCSTSFLKLIFEFLVSCSVNQLEFFAGFALPYMLCFLFQFDALFSAKWWLPFSWLLIWFSLSL